MLVEGDGSDLYAVQAAAAPLVAPYTFALETDWGLCSEECGQGIVTRDVECRSSKDGSVRADRMCEMYAPMPRREASCYLATCTLPFGFGAGDWGECSRKCGGGTRTRELVCLDANGDPADETACSSIQALGLAPTTSQPCNLQECEVFSWIAGRWRGCDAAPCESGMQFRTVSCVGSLGNVDDTGMSCHDPQPAFARACDASCFPFQWRSGDWSVCGSPCGGEATSTRTVECIDTENGNAVVSSSLCSSNAEPQSSRPCNTGLCGGTPHWEVGPLGACSEACGGGLQTRTVECVDSSGTVVSDEQCSDSGAKPAPTVSCNTLPCDPCDDVLCFSPNGECIAGVCVCREGFYGGRCASTTADCPVAAADGTCCASGTVDSVGTCCVGASPTVDKDGNCCASGELDECGVCDGVSLRDARGVCCSANAAIDSSGVCCESGSIDACGVCDGSATTCSLQATADVDAPPGTTSLALYDGSLEAAQLRAAGLPDLLAALLPVASDAIVVQSLDLAPSADDDIRRRALLGGSFSSIDGAQLRVTFTVDDSTTTLDRVLGDLEAAVEAPGSGVTAVTGLAVAGVCGNGICEAGEACIAQSGGATLASGGNCCPADCSLVSLPCPTSPAGVGELPVECGGTARGACIAATGECSCYEAAGYTGRACGDCAAGFVPVRGACVALYGVAGQPTTPSSGSGSDDSNSDSQGGSGAFTGTDDDPTPIINSGSGGTGSRGTGSSTGPDGQGTNSGPGDVDGPGEGGLGVGYIVLIVVAVLAAAGLVYKLLVQPRARRRAEQRAGLHRMDSNMSEAEMHGLAPSHEVGSVTSSTYEL